MTLADGSQESILVMTVSVFACQQRRRVLRWLWTGYDGIPLGISVFGRLEAIGKVQGWVRSPGGDCSWMLLVGLLRAVQGPGSP